MKRSNKFDTMRSFKILILIIFISGLSASAQKNCTPTFSDYRGYMTKVIFNTIYHASFVKDYDGYTFDTSLKTELLIGKSYDMSFYADDPGKYAAWIDYDNDSVFSSSELIFSDTIPKRNVYRTVIIPKDSSYLGLRRLRILYIWNGSLSPCGQYEEGECRDYLVNIVSSPSFQIHDYCIPICTSPYPIDKFSINKLINQHSGADSLGYILYPDSIFTTYLKMGQTYPVQISSGMTAGAPGGFAVWIDLNNDGFFALQERLFHVGPNLYSVSGYITIPIDSSFIGKRRLRVMSEWEEEPIEPCIKYPFSHRETEDYIIRITPECSPPPKPDTISGSNSMCNGSTQIYSIRSVEGALYYKWVLPTGWKGYSKDTFITVITGNSEGVISVFASDTCEDSPPQTIAVQPIIDTSITENWGVLTSGTTDAIYQWIRCETMLPITGATNRNYTPVYNGAFAVIMTKMSCTDTSACYEFWHVGETEVLPENYLTITPNPILNGKVTVTSQKKIDSIEIYNLIGERIYSQNEIENPKTEIDLSGHNSEIYFFYVRSGNTISTKKIIKLAD